MTFFVLALQGCASTETAPVDPFAWKERTVSRTQEDVKVTVGMPSIAEAAAIYGVDLSLEQIQPVWIEVENDSTVPYWLLPSGMDPNYFSPPEAAFAFHTASDEANRQLDETFQELQFKNPVRPGESTSGFLLVNLDEGFKAIDVDLISRSGSRNFSFVLADPGFRADFKMVDFDALYEPDDIIQLTEDDELRDLLEALPCCTTDASGEENGDPLNLVLIGNANDIVSALVRRQWHATEVLSSSSVMRTIKTYLQGERYRYSPISPLYVYGRPQDIGWQKARSTIRERAHARFWLSPIRYRGRQVFVGQISRDIGVKFTFKSPTISTHVIDPDVDESRRYFIEDLAYSQALSRFGLVKGVGVLSRSEPGFNLVGDPFYTDGLRAVLFFEPRPYSLSEIDFLQWEMPPPRQTLREISLEEPQ